MTTLVFTCVLAACSQSGDKKAADKSVATDSWPNFRTGTWVIKGGFGPGAARGAPPAVGGSPPGAAAGGGAAGMGGINPDAGGVGSAGIVRDEQGNAVAFNVFGSFIVPQMARGAPKLKPELQAEVGKYWEWRANGGTSCEPQGVIVDTGSRFFFDKDVIIIAGMSDWYNTWRRIYMNRTEHPKRMAPTYFGDSIGHWEDGTLVIDTVHIRAEAFLPQGLPVGNPDTHMVERYRLVDENTLELVKTVENPDFLEPWVSTTTFVRDVKAPEFTESYCWHDPEAYSFEDFMAGKKPTHGDE